MWHHKENYNINQKVADTINAITLTKYQMYPLKIILKHENILAEVIKSHCVNLYKITPYNKCTSLKSTCAQ